MVLLDVETKRRLKLSTFDNCRTLQRCRLDNNTARAVRCGRQITYLLRPRDCSQYMGEERRLPVSKQTQHGSQHAAMNINAA